MTRMLKILFFLLIFPVVGNGILYSAETPGKNESVTAPVSEAGASGELPADGGDEAHVQALLTTLNETLEENRKIREALKSVQKAYEEKSVENTRLTGQIQNLQDLSISGSKQLTDKVAELQGKLQQSAEIVQSAETEKKNFESEKQKILDESKELKLENEKVVGLLKTSILEEEKQEILKSLDRNEEAASKAVTQLADARSENARLKDELDQTYYNLGNSFLQVRDYKAAAEQYEKALEWNPFNAWAHHNLGVVYDYYLDKEELALYHYQKYLDFVPAREDANEVRRRILDLNMLKKVTPETPLKVDFKQLHKDKVNG